MSFRYRVATVFGGSGFIGRHLIKRLAKTGTVIRIATRHPSSANFLRTNGAVGQIVPIAVDIRDDASVAAAVRGSDIVINLIGILYESGVNSFKGTQAEAPARIARAAKAAGAQRFIQISAIGADAKSKSAYARTKAAGEQAVREAFPEATILRPSVVFGPEDGFFNRFAAMARVLPALPLIGGGHTKFQPVYVGDVADAIMKALASAEAPGKTYELGGPRVYTFKELMELVLAETKRKRFLVSVPWSVAEFQGKVLGKLPKPMLTEDQVELLRSDNVVAPGAATLADLGISPTAAEVIIPTYLDRYRIGGRFSQRAGYGT
ncbi:3-beta-hydroxy-delta(5)-steroid dehydrogenase [Skermanella stibiiresistens SB22]|uniref:3-beta-hydroxy-delta(5)-steroid dehydrogenase n=1 Tax=Skermanella stibiiresistens SB22 TaxID=1385369 RepID=W9GVW7_9PROT|nr:complex I NDUFA9 subunit family protein [Skermanella stibiiresistens]EWY38050.1 3-beta-hydroxy-delta(5)-steroid dehydrogenase [Skermanella stibiiresistens SB22]